MTEVRELSLTRHIDAPPDKVWSVLADRQEEWFCPRPWRAEIGHQDRRAGGRCEMTFYGTDGEVMPQNGIYLAFDEGRRFVTTDALAYGEDGDFQPAGRSWSASGKSSPKATAPASPAAPGTGPTRRSNSTSRWVSRPAGASWPISSKPSARLDLLELFL